MIVGSHSNLFMLLGGAHLLVGLAGFNFAPLPADRPAAEGADEEPGHEHRPGRRTQRPLAVPSPPRPAGSTSLLNVTLLNGVLGSREWTESWHYWFIEALVWTLVALTASPRHPRDRPARTATPVLVPDGPGGGSPADHAYDVVRLFAAGRRLHPPCPRRSSGCSPSAGPPCKAPTYRHRLLVSAVTIAHRARVLRGRPAPPGGDDRRRHAPADLAAVRPGPGRRREGSPASWPARASTSTWSTGRSTRRTSSRCRGWRPASPWPPGSRSGGW